MRGYTTPPYMFLLPANGPRSSSSTDRPARASTVAAHEPAGPAPTTIDVVVAAQPSEARRSSASSTALASVTTARSAICIIGQCGSVLTLMMWAGVPRPAVCCTAPLIPNAR